MAPYTVALVLTLVVSLLATAVSLEEDAEIESDEFDVKPVSTEKRVYGGKEILPPPTSLTVTEEIWFDLRIQDYYGPDEDFTGRVTIGCFGKLTPITCLNFVSLAKGYKKGRSTMSYKNTKVQTIVRDFMIQMGDVRTKHESGNSIFGNNFQDESFAISHNHAGWVGMANFGPDTNGSQFYVLLRSARWLDGRYVIFGKVLSGMDTIEKIGLEETDKSQNPIRPVTIDDCGVVGLTDPYTLTADQFNTDGDIAKDKN
ncbi:peptidyl-prolyl cis-trans isomerase B-like [Physella acuta]|uniref:peptidyl-prolyl cis-trans isomerase B-like n=1 Tax=Physella acuta TaxID=109671 RepID=UPI0027DB5641|nr:peptidyl-prolyl cis-trans isomerase B-like [Physella acuta]